MNVAIAGGTGFVGSRLVEKLLADGHTVRVLTRDVTKGRKALAKLPAAQSSSLTLVTYDPFDVDSWLGGLEGMDGVVNLAGEPLTGERWTPQQKEKILQSRARGTTCMVEAIAKLDRKPQVVVNASAVGYYGPHGDEILDETSPTANDFLARVCQAWEAAAKGVTDLGVRLVQLRIGIVLGPNGGALGQMVGPFQLFMGGPIGSGEQWLSWIHRDDLVGAIAFALTHTEVSGVLNATAPNPAKMKDFSHTLGQVIARPSWLPVPGFALELLLGEAAQVVLTGQRVLPKRTLEVGYSFQYPELKPALRQILVG